jgi:hypothetical protein
MTTHVTDIFSQQPVPRCDWVDFQILGDGSYQAGWFGQLIALGAAEDIARLAAQHFLDNGGLPDDCIAGHLDGLELPGLTLAELAPAPPPDDTA